MSFGNRVRFGNPAAPIPTQRQQLFNKPIRRNYQMNALTRRLYRTLATLSVMGMLLMPTLSAHAAPLDTTPKNTPPVGSANPGKLEQALAKELGTTLPFGSNQSSQDQACNGQIVGQGRNWVSVCWVGRMNF